MAQQPAMTGMHPYPAVAMADRIMPATASALHHANSSTPRVLCKRMSVGYSVHCSLSERRS